MTNQKPPRPAGNRHQFVFFVTLREILHLGGNNPGLHVDLSRFQSLNQPGRGRIAKDVHASRLDSWLGWFSGGRRRAKHRSSFLMNRLGSP